MTEEHWDETEVVIKELIEDIVAIATEWAICLHLFPHATKFFPLIPFFID